jgi:hypothetical protein
MKTPQSDGGSFPGQGQWFSATLYSVFGSSIKYQTATVPCDQPKQLLKTVASAANLFRKENSNEIS